MRIFLYKTLAICSSSVCIIAALYVGYVSTQNTFATNTEMEIMPTPIPTTEVQVVAQADVSFMPPTLNAQGAFLAEVDIDNNALFVVYEKNSTSTLPIASISKLVTAYETIQHKNLTDVLTVSQDAMRGMWSSGKFVPGTQVSVYELLQAMLVESNNDAARILAAAQNRNEFIANMNTASALMALSNTKFFSSDGVDVVSQNRTYSNQSNAEEVSRMLVQLYQKMPGILQVTTVPFATISDANNSTLFVSESTNKLIPKFNNGYVLLAGKTGTSSVNNRHLTLLFKVPSGKMYVATVLNSPTHFEDMEKLIFTLK